ncbi:UNVERIFIED_CONTAM: hypothetical protein Sradi_7158400 [Sesamum radiatum]|uniref:Uncharacterized protein n=1 Tax=Sesamum radiatum TaxID=300843 RepID=A0AAW2IVZ1_SESRA
MAESLMFPPLPETPPLARRNELERVDARRRKPPPPVCRYHLPVKTTQSTFCIERSFSHSQRKLSTCHHSRYSNSAVVQSQNPQLTAD